MASRWVKPGRMSSLQAQTNMLGVLSRIKVDMPHNSRASRGWRRRAGSSRYSFRSTVSQDSSKGVSRGLVLSRVMSCHVVSCRTPPRG